MAPGDEFDTVKALQKYNGGLKIGDAIKGIEHVVVLLEALPPGDAQLRDYSYLAQEGIGERSRTRAGGNSEFGDFLEEAVATADPQGGRHRAQSPESERERRSSFRWRL